MRKKVLHVLRARLLSICICTALLCGIFFVSNVNAKTYYDDDPIDPAMPLRITKIVAEADPGSLANDGFLVDGTYHLSVTIKNYSGTEFSIDGYRLEVAYADQFVDVSGTLRASESKTYTIEGCEVLEMWGEKDNSNRVWLRRLSDNEVCLSKGYSYEVSAIGSPAKLVIEPTIAENFQMNSAAPFSVKITNVSATGTVKNINTEIYSHNNDSADYKDIKNRITLNPSDKVTASEKGWTISELRPRESITVAGNITFLRATPEWGGIVEIICTGDVDDNEDFTEMEWRTDVSITVISDGSTVEPDVPDDNPDDTDQPDDGDEPDDDDQTNTKPQISVTNVKLSGVSKKIAAGKKVKLTASIAPSNATNKTVTWRSSNTKVATVNKSGVVTVNKNAGGKSVTITAIAADGSGKKGSVTITAMKGAVKKVSVTGKKSVKAGKAIKLNAKVTAGKKANKTVKWTSSNKKYATVSSSGKVKAYKAGKGKKVKITAKATDGSGKKGTITIKVK